MRFRSGTLERSVRRWGPKFRGPKLQRVGHSWKYVELEDSAIGRDGATASDIVISEADDWVLAGTATGVKNMTVDLEVSMAWTPDVSGLGTTFDSWMVKWGLFCLDTDDTGSSIDTLFGSTRALKWGTVVRNTKTLTNVGTLTDGVNRHATFRVRARQRFMKLDDELRFVLQFASNTTAAISDARLFIFGRVSWETP